MQQPVIGGQPIVGIYATIDPRTYPVPGSEPVKTQQKEIVLHRLEQVCKLASGIKLHDGVPLRVIKADIPVGGPAEAAQVRRQFEQAGVIIVINSMTTWSMGWETGVEFGHPEWLVAYEAMNGTAWPGAVLLNSKRASATAHLHPVVSIYPRDVQADPNGPLHADSISKIIKFLKSAAAVVQMRGTSYASMGHISMGIGGSENISDIFDRWFGMMLVHIDQIEIAKRVEKGMFDADECYKAAEWFMKTFAGRIDPEGKRHPDHIERLVYDQLVPMTLVVRGIMRGDDSIEDEERRQGCNALVGGTAGQRYLTDWYPNFDFTEAWLSSTFDWNGIRPPITLATENDGLNGMCMLLGTLLTGSASLFADLRTYWSPKAIKEATGVDISAIAPTGFVHLINSGPAALDWATHPGHLDGDLRMKEAIKNTTWYPAELGYFPGDGLSTHFCTPGDIPITMLRLNRIGLDLSISVVEGHTIALPEKVADYVRSVTNPTWPDTFASLDHGADTFEYMDKGNDPNHNVSVVGHVGGDILTTATILRIPVDFTNVPKGNILRPTLWTRLGGDREACCRLGPLYA